jgi:NAD(P)-dependent dehydrogenase (short-subunit alcohol dehydrogenase family)
MSAVSAPPFSLSRFRLDGKVAVVTGASSGLGVAFATALAEAGADVALGARRAERLADTQASVEALGRRAIAVPTDVSVPEDCDALTAAAKDEFGHVDILVNNAGVSDAVPALRQSVEDFRRVLDVNLCGAYWMAQACGRVMQPGSSVINISSVIGMTRGDIPSAAYSSSKAAVIGLTRDLASQWSSRRGIRVNALAPGYIATELTAPLIENETLLATVLARTPMGRMGEPYEVCGPLVFLASDASSYVTGITLPVDGGWTMP